MIETHFLDCNDKHRNDVSPFFVETHSQSFLFMINRLVNETNKNVAPVINQALSVRASLGSYSNFFFLQKNCLLKELTTDQSRAGSLRH